jgi:protein-tyrosine phosphatase
MTPEKLLETCRTYGIRTVVDFRKQNDRAQKEAAVIQGTGIRHVHLPSTQVPPAEAVVAFLELMDDPGNRPVLIHCTHGVGRTGVFTAIYRMEYQGWSNERARREALMMAGFESFRKNTPKGEFLREYSPRKPNSD